MPLMLHAQGDLNKKSNFSCVNCKPASALVQLARQEGINIVFSERFFAKCPPSDYLLVEMPFLEVISKITECANVDYKILDNQVILFKRNTKFNLNGYISDVATGERILGASLRIISEKGIGTTSNEFGFYSLLLLEGTYTLQVSFVGYKPDTLKIDLNSDRTLRIRLNPNTELKEVVISDAASRGLKRAVGESPKDLSIKELRNMPAPGGEPDLLRYAAMQAGVQTGVDGLGGLTVRGGNADQNLFLLDDVPVYSPSHALGLFSVFNPATISSAKLWKGDFPARYGGRASSVLDVRTRDGNFKEPHAEASAGLFAASAIIEGPIKKERSSFLVGYRNTYFDPWVKFLNNRKNLLNFTGDQISYRFYDTNVKLNYIFSDKDRLYLSVYSGGDNFNNSYAQRYDSPFGLLTETSSIKSEWGNNIAALRWNHLLRQNLFTNTTLRFSKFNYTSRLKFNSSELFPDGKEQVNSDFAQLYQTIIQDWSGKTDFTFFISDRLTARWGAAHTQHNFQPGTFSANFLQPGLLATSLDSLQSVLLNNERITATETEGYVEVEWAPIRNWRIESGVHASVFQSKNINYQYILPRFRLQRSGKKGWSQWVGYHKTAQYLHQVGSYNVSLPFELWVPSTQKVAPEEIIQVSAGFGWQNQHYSWQIKGYDKNFLRVLTFISTNDALSLGGAEDATGWEDRISSGVGHSKGLEFVFEKISGRSTGQMAYTLSKTTRQFDDINSGRVFPFRFDRRHDFKISLKQEFTKWFNVSALWAYASGNPITLAGVKYRHESVEGSTKREVFLYTEVNGYRLPAYHRLDLVANFNFKTGRIRHDFQIGGYNLYNRANPFFLFVDASSGIKGKAIQYTLFPILPSLRYGIKF